jgi:uncharacterized protein YdhG (YjbR/CyaY superfamily)
MSGPPDPIGTHLAALPQPQRHTLNALRDVLRDLLSDAEECISYNMPCFKVDGVAVAGFDGFKQHCSYFPHSGSVLAQISDLPDWCKVASKGTLQFPVDRPLPKAVVRKLVRARLDEIARTQGSPRRR